MNGKTNDTARKWLTRLSLAAGIAFTAHAEFNLAKAMGADPLIAAMLPVAIDAYAMAALRWFKGFDIALSLSLMGAAQVAAHLLDAQLVTVNVTMVTVVSLLVPVSIWRTHALARGDHAESAAQDTPAVVVDRVDTPPVLAPQVSSQVSSEVSSPPLPALTPAPALSLVICGDSLGVPEVPHLAGVSSGVSGEVSSRLPADAARAVIENCHVRGTSVAEAARVSTRSVSFVKKVYRELDEAQQAQQVPGQISLVEAMVAS